MIEIIRLFLFMGFIIAVSVGLAWVLDRNRNGFCWLIGLLTGVALTLIYLK